MPEITDITRRRGEALIKLSDGSVLRLPSAMTAHFGLRKGTDIRPEVFLKRLEAESLPFALGEIVKMQARRDHSSGEITRALRDRGYPEETAAAALEQLTAAGIVDDDRFGEILVHRRQRQRGRTAMRQEMRGKGLDPETIERSLEHLSDDAEYGAAVLRARKMAQRGIGDIKIAAALERRGYSRALIRRVLSDIVTEPGEE
ncbi:MAG: regulatory protein RecX [Clostridia bacterium]|nr:regulatory protein RecX [Clostridia bacterium]